jgi:peptidoglycan hydrolase-like protein with peptidoglycan-binding domain
MIKKLIVGAASVMALGIGGAALDFSAYADDVANAQPEPSYHWLNAANPSKDDIRWTQVELHIQGFYNGSLDGVAGPETKRALLRFQKSNGLEPTATLDQQTANALIGDTAVGQGSSMPPKGAGAGSMTRSSDRSDFGGSVGQK